MRGLSRRLEPLFRGRRVLFAYLWGSRARKRHGPRSDYDIAVSLERDPMNRFLDLGTDLSRELGTDDVDLTLLEDANAEVRFLVQRLGRLIYDADPAARMAFERRARSVYREESFRLRRYDASLWGRVSDGTFGA